jgi:signal transduction histidine kinase
MVFTDSSGTVVFSKAYYLENLTEMPIDSNLFKPENFVLLNQTQFDSKVEGLVKTAEGLMMVVSHPILTSNYEGPIGGTLLMGRLLDLSSVNTLSNVIGLPITLYQTNDPNMVPDVLEANYTLTKGIESFSDPVNETAIAGFTFLKDINSNPIGIASIVDSREDYNQAKVSIAYLGISVLAVGLCFLAASYLLLDKFVISRLSRLKTNVEKIRLTGTSANRVEVKGNDELSGLAQKINQMLEVIDSSQIKLNEYAENLEKKVDEKTKALIETQTKLLQSERFAAVGQMAAMVGHDLRNPLTGMKNATYFLEKNASTQLDEKGRKMIEYIKRDLDYATAILNDLLDFSREIKLEKEVIKLEVLLSYSLLASRTNDKIRVINSVDKNQEIRVAVDKMQRVFMNLINNAMDAMPEGGTLTIRSTVNAKSVEVSFDDTGSGISLENLNNLFQPLFTTKSKGIGLGLLICKRFVDAHKGTITVTSKQGKGTTFTVSIPLNEEKKNINPQSIEISLQ